MRPAFRPPIFPLLLLCVATLGIALGIGTQYFAIHSHGVGWLPGVLQPRDSFPGKSRINIAIMGIDENYDSKGMEYTKNARTDTLLVLSLDLDTQKAYLLSIPRDSRVRIAGTDHWGKINGAYATGGVNRAVQTLSNFVGVPIDFYVVLRIETTKKLVDSIGGVDLMVEKDMNYDDNWGHLHIHLKKGFQHLNGEQAVGYIRFRHDSDGDFGRIRRQQQLLHVIAEKLKNPMMAFQLPSIEAAFRQSVDTNLTDGQIAALGMLFHQVSPSQIVSSYVPGSDERINGPWYLVPDEAKKKAVVDWLLRGNPDGEIPLVRVLVTDGCANKAATAAVRDRLKAMGFQVITGANADRSDYATSQVIDYDRLKQAGALVASKLALTTAPLVQPDPQADTSVELIVGRDLADADLASRPPAN